MGEPAKRPIPDGDGRAGEATARRRTVLRSRLAVSVVCVFVAAVYTQQATELSVGDFSRPGPGLYPIMVGVGLVAVSVVAVAEALLHLRRTARDGHDAVADDLSGVESLAPAGRRRMAALGGMLLAYVVMLRLVGFVVATVPFVVVTGWILHAGRRQPATGLRLLLVAVVLALLVDWLFRQVFKVQLPQAVLF